MVAGADESWYLSLKYALQPTHLRDMLDIPDEEIAHFSSYREDRRATMQIIMTTIPARVYDSLTNQGWNPLRDGPFAMGQKVRDASAAAARVDVANLIIKANQLHRERKLPTRSREWIEGYLMGVIEPFRYDAHGWYEDRNLLERAQELYCGCRISPGQRRHALGICRQGQT